MEEAASTDCESNFNSPDDVSNFMMPYEFSWSTSDWRDSLCVFRSRRNNELQSLFGSSYPRVSGHQSGLKQKIKECLESILMPTSTKLLFQFWEPVTIGERYYLTTAHQPFLLNYFHKGLCLYRKLCLPMLIPVDEEDKGGPVARVFRSRQSEFGCDVSLYHSVEYPLREDAIKCCIKNYEAWPLSEPNRKGCVGVLEIVSTCERQYLMMNLLYRRLKAKDVANDVPFSSIRCSKIYEYICSKKVHHIMEQICQGHQLSYARLWIANSSMKDMHNISNYKMCDVGGGVCGWFTVCPLWEAKEVVGTAFANRGGCFCNDVSELSINVCPWVPVARKLELSRCFAVCLQSSIRDEDFYILEFFWPPTRTDYADPRIFIYRLFASLKMKIESSNGAKVQKLEEKLFVEVIKTSSDNYSLDSFEISDTTQTIATLGSRVSRSGFPFRSQEIGFCSQLLGPLVSGVQSNSQVQSNSLSVQQMDLDMRLGPPDGTQNHSADDPNSPSSVQMSWEPHRPEGGDYSISSSSVRNYSFPPQERSVISNTDSDSDIRNFCEILRNAKGGRPRKINR